MIKGQMEESIKLLTELVDELFEDYVFRSQPDMPSVFDKQLDVFRKKMKELKDINGISHI